MKKMIYLVALALSFSSATAFAVDDERMEVDGTDLSGGVPSSLSGLTGWGGASVGAIAGVSLSAAAYKANKTTVKNAKDKAKKAAKTPGAPQQQTSFFSDLFGISSLSFGWKIDIGLKVYDPATGREIVDGHLKGCAGGATDASKPNCTLITREPFTDPSDGLDKLVTTISLVRGVYNPKHIDADAEGWAPQTIDGQSISIIHQTDAEFTWELDRLKAVQ